ncbi:hypothetical protein D3C86_1992520 [compost metagenome]
MRTNSRLSYNRLTGSNNHDLIDIPFNHGTILDDGSFAYDGALNNYITSNLRMGHNNTVFDFTKAANLGTAKQYRTLRITF